MNIQRKQTEQTVIEMTEEQFDMLTSALVSASPQEIANQARNILDQHRLEKDTSEYAKIREDIRNCRNFLNMVQIVTDIRVGLQFHHSEDPLNMDPDTKEL
jgi:hypothetical protein